ncbi:unnamed protein product [Laminaria digitata]
MEGLGVGPHEICYLAAIKACEKAGQTDQAACLAETLRGLPPTARGRVHRDEEGKGSRRRQPTEPRTSVNTVSAVSAVEAARTVSAGIAEPIRAETAQR